MTRPLSLAALTVLELAPPDMVSAAATAGFSHVGLRLIPATPTEPAHPSVGDTPMVREVRARLDATGVRVLDVEIFRLKPETRVADYRAAIETGAWLGAKHALCTGQDPVESRLVDKLGEFARLVAGYGMTADLEFMPWTEVRDLAVAARVVQAAGEANLGIVVDAYHVSRSRVRLAEFARLPRGLVRYLQLCDAPAAIPPTMDAILEEARNARRFPGEGDFDLGRAAARAAARPAGRGRGADARTRGPGRRGRTRAARADRVAFGRRPRGRGRRCRCTAGLTASRPAEAGPPGHRGPRRILALRLRTPDPAMPDAFLCDAIRTPIGRYGGALAPVRTDDLAAIPIRALIERNARVDWAAVDDVVYGCANQAGEDNRNVARMASLLAGLPESVAGTTVNRLCGSSLDAIAIAARAIRAGEQSLVIAGGVESMSRAPFVQGKATEAYARAAKLEDTTIGWRFVNPLMKARFGIDSMPETAENVAAEFGIARADQDAFALRSQQRAARRDRLGPARARDRARRDPVAEGRTRCSSTATSIRARPRSTRSRSSRAS